MTMDNQGPYDGPPTSGWPTGPMMATPQDHDHLRLLSIFYYVVAAIHGLAILIALAWLLLGTTLMGGLSVMTRSAAPLAIIAIVAVAVLLALAMTGLICYLYCLVARSLTEHTHYTLILVLAGLTCFSPPLGTALGVFTFIVLLRPGVKALFGQA